MPLTKQIANSPGLSEHQIDDTILTNMQDVVNHLADVMFDSAKVDSCFYTGEHNALTLHWWSMNEHGPYYDLRLTRSHWHSWTFYWWDEPGERRRLKAYHFPTTTERILSDIKYILDKFKTL